MCDELFSLQTEQSSSDLLKLVEDRQKFAAILGTTARSWPICRPGCSSPRRS